MGPEKRPSFCRKAQCPNYLYDPCRLKNWVIQGWPRRASRQKEYERLEEIAENEPHEIIRMCVEKGL